MKLTPFFFVTLVIALNPNLSGAQPNDVPLPVGVVREDIPAGKLKEYTDHVRNREKRIKQLPEGTTAKLDIPYVPQAFQGKIPDSNQTLDLYVPKGDGPFPLIVYIHGGAWKGGSKSGEGALIANRFVPEGFAVASLDYRFVFDAEFPGMFQDCIDAIAFLRRHSAEFHLDPQRIGLVGMSAGAHIAGLVGMAEGDRRFERTGPAVQAVVVLSGFYDLTSETGQWPPGKFQSNPKDDFAGIYPGRTYDTKIAKAMSPVYNIHAGIPPVLIVWGEKDTAAPQIQSTLFRDALQKAGSKVTYSTYPNHGHGLLEPDVFDEMLAFYQKYLNVK